MKKNILITGVGGRSIGAGILQSLLFDKTALKRWNIISADCDDFSWGLYKTVHSVLLPPASNAHYIEFLHDLIKKYHIHAIIPGTQAEGEKIVNHVKALSPALVIANKKELYPLMMDKFIMNETMKKLKLNYIETLPFNRWHDLFRKYGFPLIVKPTKETGGSKGLHIVCSKKEIEFIENFIDDKSFPCIQPYIGDFENEYTVGVLTDKNGGLIDSIIVKRKLTGLSLLTKRNYNNNLYAASTGYSQGFVIKNKQIQNYCEELALKLKSVGPLNIQLRVANNKIYIFEIHPRFSGTTPIRASVGFNEVDFLLRNFIFGETFKRQNYKHDVAAIRTFCHVITPISKMLKNKK